MLLKKKRMKGGERVPLRRDEKSRKAGRLALVQIHFNSPDEPEGAGSSWLESLEWPLLWSNLHYN